MTTPARHAVVVAAGSGTRFGEDNPKQLVDLAGRTILERSVDALRAGAYFTSLVVVTRADLVDRVATLLGDAASDVVAGGESRRDSVRLGLAAIDAPDDDHVLVHDAARPLVSADEVAAVADALGNADGATVALRASDTILEVDDGLVVTEVPDRRRFFRAQTPQGFRIGVLRRAHAAAAAAGFAATDDTGVVARFAPDARIVVVPGSPRNLKITTQRDLEAAERLLAEG